MNSTQHTISTVCMLRITITIVISHRSTKGLPVALDPRQPGGARSQDTVDACSKFHCFHDFAQLCAPDDLRFLRHLPSGLPPSVPQPALVPRLPPGSFPSSQLPTLPSSSFLYDWVQTTVSVFVALGADTYPVKRREGVNHRMVPSGHCVWTPLGQNGGRATPRPAPSMRQYGIISAFLTVSQ